VTRKISGAIFDLDGTLVDSFKSIKQSFKFAVGALQHPRVKFSPGVGFKDQVEEAGMDYQQFLATYFKHQSMFKSETRLMPGVSLGLVDLDVVGLHLGVATMRPTWNAQELLQFHMVSSRFHCVVGTDPGVPRKPDQHIVNACANGLGLKPDQCVMVGDSDSDMTAGKAAGCVTVGIGPRVWSADVKAKTIGDAFRAILRMNLFPAIDVVHEGW
jgi:phosphoglycolate phosphatase-like HAD superfamily hydrolase